MLINAGLILAGLVLLALGGEGLVRGAGSLARQLGMSSRVVGLTVVSIATSAPELAVTLGSVFSGKAELAVGNVVGSNIANVLFILGAGALLAPLAATRQSVKVDLPIMLGFSVLLVLLVLDNRVGPLDGVLLLGVFVAMMVYTVRQSRGAPESGELAEADEASLARSPWQSVLLVVLGVGGLVVGAQLMVRGAVAIAEAMGVSNLVIGLTVVAIGTSLPELAATVAAVRKGEVDMAVGNVVGSNIANIGLVLGLPSLLGGGIPVPDAAVALDIPLMIAAAAVCGLLAFTGMRIVRWEGAIFLALYLAYVSYAVLAGTHHDALGDFSLVMGYFVLPLLALGLCIAVLGELKVLHRRRRAAAQSRKETS